jgi:DNA-binding transcriptional LysR family regulator
MNLTAMRVFAVAAETENFSEAARRLHLSQPAVSQQISSLEGDLGVELFVRLGRGVQLSDAGRILLPLVRSLLDQVQKIEETMRSLDGQVAGDVIIGSSTTAGKYALTFLAAAFIENYPDVRMTIRVLKDDSVEDLLLAQQLHVGTATARSMHPDIECQPYFTDRIGLVVSRDHPFAGRSSIEPIELVNHSFIWREEGCNTCQMVLDGLMEFGIHIDDLQIVMVVGSSEAIEMAVGRSLGIAFVSLMAASRGIESGNLVEVPVNGLSLERPLYAARNVRYPSTLAHERLWEFIGLYREELAQKMGLSADAASCYWLVSAE